MELLAQAAVRIGSRLSRGQLGEVNERRHQVQLAWPHWRARGDRGVSVGEVAGDRVCWRLLGQVEAQHEAPQPRKRVGGALRRRGLGPGRDHQVDRRVRRRLPGSVVRPGRLQAGQRRAGLDLAAHGDQQLAYPRAERRTQYGLHLHALQHQDLAARAHLGAHRDRRGDHQRRGRGAQHAALVPADPVGDPVHLDHVHRAVDGGRRAGRRAGSPSAGSGARPTASALRRERQSRQRRP